MLFRSPRQIQVPDPGFDPGPLRLDVHFEHPVHAGGDDDDGIADRGCATGESGTAAPGGERSAVGPGDPHRGRDLVGRTGPADDGRRARTHPGVARVEREVERIGADAIGRERSGEIGEQIGVRDAIEPSE